MTIPRATAEALFTKATGRPAPAPKKSKYGNRKVTCEGITFDSMAEARRWQQLRQMETHGRIKDLARQVSFQLAPAVRFHDAFKDKRPLTYRADFTYTDENDNLIIEDVKGHITDEFIIKRHLMKAYLGLDIRIVKC